MSENPNYNPTPDQICEACLQIQTAWSDRERVRRMGVDPDTKGRWTVPEVKLQSQLI